MRVLRLVVLMLAASASAQVGTRSAGFQGASGLQDRPAIATWNGVTWAAWVDTSDARYFDVTRVLVSRLAPDGTPLDQPGVALPFNAPADLTPRLGVCGGQLWALWSALVPGTGTAMAVAPLSVGAQGVTVGTPTWFTYSTSGPALALAEGPTDCLAAWRSSNNVVGVRLPLVTGTTPTVVTTTFVADLQLAHDGTRYVATGTTSTGLYGFFIDPGTLQAGAAMTWATWATSADSSSRTTLAAADGTALVGWTTSGGTGLQRVLWVAPSGSVRAGPTTIDAGVGQALVPAVAAYDGGFALLVAGNTASSAVLALTALDNDGGVGASPLLLPVPPAYFPRGGSVALGQRNGTLVALSAYGNAAPEPQDIFAHVLGTWAAPSPPAVVSLSSGAQHGPFVAALGDEVLAAWTEARRPPQPDTVVQYVDQPYVARFAPWGQLQDLDAVPTVASPASFAGSANVTGLAPTPSGWQVAWADAVLKELWTANVDGTSGAVGGRVLQFSNASRGTLAGDGTSTLLAVASGVSWARAQRLDAQGTPVGAAIVLPIAFTDSLGRLSAAAGASGWLVANASFGGSATTVTLQAIDATGALGAAATRSYGLPGTVQRSAPVLAWNGSEWLLAVQSGPCTVALERLSSSLASLGTAALQSYASCPDGAAVTPSFDGGWFIAYRDGDITGAALHLRNFRASLDLPDDAVLASGRGLGWPALAPLDAGVLAVAFMKLVDDAPFGTWRVQLEHWPASPLSSPPDAGAADAGAADAGAADAGAADAGAADAGAEDAGFPDAGSLDGGPGAPDAGPGDGGSEVADAGGGPGGAGRPCGCAGGPAAPALFLFLALALRRRRRHR